MTDNNYAIVENGIVINTVSAPDGYVDPETSTTTVKLDQITAGIGWAYDGKTFTAPVLVTPALTVPELLAYASTKQNTILAQVWTVDLGTSSAPLKLTTKLDTAGQGAMMKLALWGMLNSQVSSALEPYSNVDYSTASLTPAQATQMGTLTGQIVSQSYGTLNTVAEAVQASSPSITTKAQVDAAGWPSP